MVWIALGLLVFAFFIVALITSAGRWNMGHWRHPFRVGPRFAEFLQVLEDTRDALAWDFAGKAVLQATIGSFRTVLDKSSAFFVFSDQIVFRIFTTFLLPIWSLSFATEALGREREARNLIWVLTRPLSRPAIYLAKFVAILPWCLALNVGGFWLLCLAGGEAGRFAFHVYWPAVLCGTLAFCSLFHLMGAWFHRPAVVAILYSFFLETVLGNLPGHLKRLSISFYTRCLMFDNAHELGIHPERPTIYSPVSGTTALCVLAAATILCLAAGMIVFSRREYLDLT
jgi:ABC-type transport system involved in multi-copper enzyme maturation permease subunit